MSIENNVQTVKDFFAALGRGDKQGLLALSAETLSGLFRARTGRWPARTEGTRDWRFASEGLRDGGNFIPRAPRIHAQGDRVLVVGFATGRIKATNRTFEDHWVFAITVRNGKLTNVREYIDTQALAGASEMAASPRP